MRWPWTARRVAPELFDDDAWHELGTRNVQIARDAARLRCSRWRLNYLATLRIFEGDLDAAAALLEEAEVIADATGAAPIVFGRLQLAAFRGDEAQASVLIEASEPAALARGEGVVLELRRARGALCSTTASATIRRHWLPPRARAPRTS